MNKDYGKLGKVAVISGNKEPINGMIECFIPIVGFMNNPVYHSVVLPVESIKKGWLEVIIVEIRDNEVDVLLPGNEIILTILREWLKKRYTASFIEWMLGERVKMDELEIN